MYRAGVKRRQDGIKAEGAKKERLNEPGKPIEYKPNLGCGTPAHVYDPAKFCQASASKFHILHLYDGVGMYAGWVSM